VRRLLSPTWIGLHLLMLVLVATFIWLGHWQLDRARELQQPAGPDPAPVAIDSLDPVGSALSADAAGRLVTITGTYDPVHSYLVPGQEQAGRSGYWVLSVLRQPSGSGVLVVRGWTSDPSPAVAQSQLSGSVTVVGRLQAPQPPPDQTVELPPGQLAAVNPASLLTAVGFPLHDGYAILRTQTPPAAATLSLVPSPHQVSQSVPGFYFQHLAYVVLWWLFAAFTVFFWYRLMRDGLAGRPGDADPGTGTPAVPERAPGYAP
jgi:surfeit locus 1 family protein